MKDFLTDFYNKVVTFFQSDKEESENSKETAKSRLQLVLMQDRSNLEPENMAKLRGELVEVISKYMVIDKEALGLNIDSDGKALALTLNIPVIRAKTTAEIQEAIDTESQNFEDDDEDEEIEDDDLTETTEEVQTENVEVENEDASEGTEETTVEFSEGTIDELCECNCNGECHCDCEEQHDETDNETSISEENKNTKNKKSKKD